MVAKLTLAADSAHFKNPHFAWAYRTLEVPSPSTVRGILRGITGDPEYDPCFGYSFSHEGKNEDAMKQHKPKVGAKVRIHSEVNPAYFKEYKGDPRGTNIINIEYLLRPVLKIWVKDDSSKFRVPVWPVRLGRVEDMVVEYSLKEVDTSPVADVVLHGCVTESDVGFPLTFSVSNWQTSETRLYEQSARRDGFLDEEGDTFAWV